MKYTVIIPCFNDANYIRASVCSILQQVKGSFSYEVIVVDDGSYDDECEAALVDLIDGVLLKFIKTVNGGLSSARNAGAAMSTGDYLIFLDADDLLADRYLVELDLCLSKDSRLPDIVVSSYKYFADDDFYLPNLRRKKYNFNPPLIFGHKINYLLMTFGNCFPVSACAVSKNLFISLGGFDKNLGSLEDWDFWIRAIHSNAKIKYNTKGFSSCTEIRIRNGMMRNFKAMNANLVMVAEKHCIRMPIFFVKSRLMHRMLRVIFIFLYFYGYITIGYNPNLNFKG